MTNGLCGSVEEFIKVILKLSDNKEEKDNWEILDRKSVV